jgi:hypothetical protein
MHDHDFLPGDELERNGERYVVLDVAFLDGRILVEGPRGQEPIEPEGFSLVSID